MKPKIRRKFTSPGDELYYLRDMISYLVKQRKSAARYINRFGVILTEMGLDDGSIMLQDHWSWWLELTGDYSEAVRHRRREAKIIRKLFRLGGPVGPINQKFLASVERHLQRNQKILARDNKEH